RRAAGLHLVDDGELDVLCRHDLRPGRAVLSARLARHAAPAQFGMSMLEVRNVTKRFGNLVAVNDVSMSVKPGELRAIIGPNGAGKTTFFNMISGYFAPTKGSILFSGNDVTRFPAHQRVGLGMGLTFQITE